MNFKKIILIITLFLIPIEATIYENAEDKKKSKWKVLQTEYPSSIHNLYDRKKVSRIIHFEGEGTKSLYKLENTYKINRHRKKEYWLTWEMKYSEDFVIIVVLETRLGKRYMIYTPGINNSYMQYGLGLNTLNGKWHKYKRNLQKDLRYYDNRNEVISFKSFVIKGSGSVDNIATMSDKVFKKVYFHNSKNKSSLPKITIKGENPLHLKIGEHYVEPGVSASDKEDGTLNVVSIENIDTSRDGEYTVMYMATNQKGDMAVDSRLVEVGEGKKEMQVHNIEKKSVDIKELDKIFEETEAWERELELKEQAFREKVNNSEET